MAFSKRTRIIAALSLSVVFLGAAALIFAPWEFVPRIATAQHDESEDGHAHDEGKKDSHGHADHSDEHDDHGNTEGEDEHAHDKGEDAHQEDEDDHAHNEGGEDSHGHDDHADEHGGHEDEGLQFSDAEIAEFGITIGKAGSGRLNIRSSLPGEVRLNADTLAHVVPRLPGIVREVLVTLGARVEKGQAMVVLESRELATAKVSYLAARERSVLAQSAFNREQRLWEEKISAERDYLEAKNARAEADIARRGAEQELEALGLSPDIIKTLGRQSGESLTRYEVTAPLDGTVIAKHVTLGEYVETNADIFTVAELDSVWVDLNVFQKDMPFVRTGQNVIIETDVALPDVTGTISYLGPLVGEATRTSLARIVLPNPDGLWRPGMFVNGRVSIDELDLPIVLPKSALLSIDDKIQVFVKDSEDFEAVVVKVGRSDKTHAEILSGLRVGQEYVATGGFHLKAEMGKAAFAEGGHSH